MSKSKENSLGAFAASGGNTKFPVCGGDHTELDGFQRLGIVLRLPLFVVLVILKIVIVFPLELIIFKIVMGGVLFVWSVLGIAKSVFFSDKYELKECEDTIKEIGESYFDFESLDFVGVVHFLRYGRFE